MPAKLSKRLVAYVIDKLILLLLFTVTYLLFGQITESQGIRMFKLDSNIVGMFVFMWLLYYPLAWWIFGWSVGKRLMGIRVVNRKLGKISLGQAFLRLFARSIMLLIGGVIAQGLYLWLYDERRETLYDKIAGTLVIEA